MYQWKLNQYPFNIHKIKKKKKDKLIVSRYIQNNFFIKMEFGFLLYF